MPNIKQQHGSPNPIIENEEQMMLSAVDKVISAGGNPQTIGRTGELPLLRFLSRHLPRTLNAVCGHFVTPSGDLSPQIDCLVLDSRYPYLAQNDDESMLAMLHSVIACIEVKTRGQKRDIKTCHANATKIHGLAGEVFQGGFSTVASEIFMYRSGVRLETLADWYFDLFVDDSSHSDLYLLRVPEADRVGEVDHGAFFHLEPDVGDSDEVEEWIPTMVHFYTPLSDFYYSLIQSSYYCLDDRGFTYSNIGCHITDYMSWSTILKS